MHAAADSEPVLACVYSLPRSGSTALMAQVGRWKVFARAGGRFIVLRRNPLNVFESQFRVEFGRNNRNALRFAAFAESYEAAFSRLPKQLTACIDYESIPEQLPSILAFLGL